MRKCSFRDPVSVLLRILCVNKTPTAYPFIRNYRALKEEFFWGAYFIDPESKGKKCKYFFYIKRMFMVALEKKYIGLPTASSDGTARLWNTRTGALKREYQARSSLSKGIGS
jgi:hypothetical protein